MPVIEMTPEQLQAILKAAVGEAVAQATKMNPIQQKQYDEEIAKEKRKNAMMHQLGKIEEEAARAKRDSCSHMRIAAGKNAGMSAPRGAMGEEWCTGGQAYQDGTAMVICLRCSSTWRFRPSAEDYSAILQNGLLGAMPPPDEYVLCDGCLELKAKCRCAELFPTAAVANV